MTTFLKLIFSDGLGKGDISVWNSSMGGIGGKDVCMGGGIRDRRRGGLSVEKRIKYYSKLIVSCQES